MAEQLDLEAIEATLAEVFECFPGRWRKWYNEHSDYWDVDYPRASEDPGGRYSILEMEGEPLCDLLVWCQQGLPALVAECRRLRGLAERTVEYQACDEITLRRVMGHWRMIICREDAPQGIDGWDTLDEAIAALEAWRHREEADR